MAVITIHRGFFRNGIEINNVVAPLVEQPTKNRGPESKQGLVLLGKIDSSNTTLSQKRRRCTVFFKSDSDYTIDENATYEVQGPVHEMDLLSDEEIAARNADKFGSLALLSEAAANLKIRAMVVAGSPGTGKTFEVTKAVESKKSLYYTHIKGTISAIALYIELYRSRDGVVILDDSDESFTDPESIQLLKAAMESTKNRKISYRKLSMALEAEGIPQEFVFNGCVVILTNTDLENASKGKSPHYSALVSRSHYINVILATTREKLIRIRQVLDESNILNSFVDKEHHADLIQFLDDNVHNFRELSIRTVVKLAELASAFPTKWKQLARGTLLK